MLSFVQRKMYERKEKEWIREYQEELMEISRKIEEQGETPDMILRKGDLLLFSNEDLEAVKQYMRLIKDDGVPSDIKAAAYGRLGNLLEDFDYLSEAIKLNKKPEYLYNRASLAIELSKGSTPGQVKDLLDTAEKDLTECIKMADFFAYYELRAITRTKKGNQEGAASDIVECFKNSYSPGDEGIYFFSQGWRLIASRFGDELRDNVIKEVGEIIKSKRREIIFNNQ